MKRQKLDLSRTAGETCTGGGPIRSHPKHSFTGDTYAHLVEHGFFKGQLDLASAVLPNPNC
jgi:hypothetical protein